MAGEENTFYVRNWRPNVVVFKYAGLKYMLQRRGHREDTTALPIEAKSDPTIARWLKIEILEEVTRDEFFALATRNVEDPKPELKPGKAADVNIPIEDRHSPTPTMVAKAKDGKEFFDDESFKREYMSPNLEWAKEPLPTSEELNLEAAIEEVEATKPAAKRGRPKKTA